MTIRNTAAAFAASPVFACNAMKKIALATALAVMIALPVKAGDVEMPPVIMAMGEWNKSLRDLEMECTSRGNRSNLSINGKLALNLVCEAAYDVVAAGYRLMAEEIESASENGARDTTSLRELSEIYEQEADDWLTQSMGLLDSLE